MVPRFGPPAKTFRWQVVTKDHQLVLGEVRWAGRWRSYAFFPSPDTMFETVCLGEIADFVRQRTEDHRAKLRSSKHSPRISTQVESLQSGGP